MKLGMVITSIFGHFRTPPPLTYPALHGFTVYKLPRLFAGAYLNAQPPSSVQGLERGHSCHRHRQLPDNLDVTSLQDIHFSEIHVDFA